MIADAFLVETPPVAPPPQALAGRMVASLRDFPPFDNRVEEWHATR